MSEINHQNMNENREDENYVSDHDYDGIRELNNPSPYWVLFLFLGTIGFSLFYAVHYFGYPNNGKDQISEYTQQMTAASQQLAGLNPGSKNSILSLDNKEMMTQGAKLFAEKGCIACHGAKGEGNAIGPNMTDNFWIHGCKPSDVLKTISGGVPEKGMTPYKSILTESQINSLTVYILGNLKGSNLPNSKAPQGVECK